MKKLFLFCFTMILIVGCNQTEQRYFSDSPEIDAVHSIITAYEKGDVETWKSHFADTAKIYSNSMKSTTIDENIKMQNDLVSNFKSYGFDDETSFIEMTVDTDGSKWVKYWGNWKGIFNANDKELSIPVHLSYNFVDGKIVKEHGFWDNAPLISALAEISEMEVDASEVENN